MHIFANLSRYSSVYHVHGHLLLLLCHLLPCKQQLVPCSPEIPVNSNLKDSHVCTPLVSLHTVECMLLRHNNNLSVQPAHTRSTQRLWDFFHFNNMVSQKLQRQIDCLRRLGLATSWKLNTGGTPHREGRHHCLHPCWIIGTILPYLCV